AFFRHSLNSSGGIISRDIPLTISAVSVWGSPPDWKMSLSVLSPESIAAIRSSACDKSDSANVQPGGAVMSERIFDSLGVCWRLGSSQEGRPVTVPVILNEG